MYTSIKLSRVKIEYIHKHLLCQSLDAVYEAATAAIHIIQTTTPKMIAAMLR